MNEQDKATLMRLRAAVRDLPPADQAAIEACIERIGQLVDAAGYRGQIALAIAAIERDVAKIA